ncbi:MAG: GMC family oxidoreductase [Chlorobi bacterium]|nr:GMC family oxidoreductase [Chlorobiota bacterium]
MVYDFLIVGSGFGGAVSALRLVEKGYSVLIAEQGKRYSAADFATSNWHFRKYLWAPLIRMYGIQKLSFFRNASILSGVGVGGGSLVYANTLFYPPQSFFRHKNWSRFGNWEEILRPYYDEAAFMLGRCINEKLYEEDRLLRETAGKMGLSETFKPVYVGVYFNDKDKSYDPYFSGLGPERTPCSECAGCMVGCRENAKNTLDKNYLFFAEKFGATILSEHKADKIEYHRGQYTVTLYNITGLPVKKRRIIHARNVVVAAGTLGTLDLLLKQKYKYKTLPALSDRLGENLLTNSETLNAITVPGKKLNNGIAISSGFHADHETHIEVVKYPDRSNLLRLFFSFAVSGDIGKHNRPYRWIKKVIFHPLGFFRFIFRKNWSSNSVILLVMQSAENAMTMVWKKGVFGSRMKIRNAGRQKVPAFIPKGQEAMNNLAKIAGGIPQNIILETLLNRPTTAHILGGCPMGDHRENGVVDSSFRVLGYPGMYITDGSVIQGNIGVNPSFSITAQAEYAMSHISEKEGNKNITLKQQINRIKHE